jgi:ribosomal protein S18 acetylase RimI-like enzyme
MRVEIIHARDHLPEQYEPALSGHRAVRLVDGKDALRGELVWRHDSDGAVEITEFGLPDPADRRKGLGSRLLSEALADIRAFYRSRKLGVATLYLFCEAGNERARAFYEARGFRLASVLQGFYNRGDAVLYVMPLGEEVSRC